MYKQCIMLIPRHRSGNNEITVAQPSHQLLNELIYTHHQCAELYLKPKLKV